MRTAVYLLVGLTAGIAGLAAGGGATLAAGPEPQVLLALTEDGVVGERAELVALVVGAEGEPVEGLKVTFMADAGFLNVFGAVTLADAVTDGSGVARAFYIPRTEGEIAISAWAEQVEDGSVIETSGVLPVKPGSPVFIPERPFRVPGANAWLVVTVLIVVWSLYLWTMWILWKVRAGGAP